VSFAPWQRTAVHPALAHTALTADGFADGIVFARRRDMRLRFVFPAFFLFVVVAASCQNEPSGPIEDDCKLAANPGCADGLLEIPPSTECPIVESQSSCGGDGYEDGCSDASDCTEKPAGYCETYSSGVGVSCGCAYGCLSDADCGDAICVCTEEGGRCQRKDCGSHAECDEGQLCVQWRVDDGCNGAPPRWSCTNELDQCRPNADPCAFDETCTPGPNGATCVGIDYCA
jgi:hypothetical protein